MEPEDRAVSLHSPPPTSIPPPGTAPLPGPAGAGWLSVMPPGDSLHPHHWLWLLSVPPQGAGSHPYHWLIVAGMHLGLRRTVLGAVSELGVILIQPLCRLCSLFSSPEQQMQEVEMGLRIERVFP